jgi:hypothetical protein
MFSGVGALSDPFKLIEAEFDASLALLSRGNQNTDPYTAVSPALVGGENTAVIITGGDSISANSVNSSYSVTQAKNHVLSIYNGGVYASLGTLLGCNTSPAAGSNYAARLADKLIVAGNYTRVILVPIAIGGTIFSRWVSGGDCFHRIGVAAARLRAQALTATHILWEQGPNDNTAGTSQVAAEAALNGIRSAFTAAGVIAPMYIAQRSKVGGVTNAAVRAAQAAVVNSTTIKAGPDNDSVSTYDGSHSDATGAGTAADNWKTALGF